MAAVERREAAGGAAAAHHRGGALLSIDSTVLKDLVLHRRLHAWHKAQVRLHTAPN